MLITFQAPHASDVTIIGKHAPIIFGAMGREYDMQNFPERGAFPKETLQDTINRMQQAIRDAKPEETEEDLNDQQDYPQEHIPSDGDHVNLKQRLWPIINLFQIALEHHEHVTWEVQSSW